MRLHSRLLLLSVLTTFGCDRGTKVEESCRGSQNVAPLLNVRNVESVRMVFHVMDYDERQEKQLQYLISVGEKAFPTYEAILSDPGADRNEVSGVLGVLYEVKADRRLFLKYALSRLKDKNFIVRVCALRLLEQIGSPTEASAVVGLLSDDRTEAVYSAAKTLAAIGGQHELESMEGWLRGDSYRNGSELREYVQKCRDDLKNRLAEKKDPTK